MRCRIKDSKVPCKVKSATAFVKSLTMIDKSKAMIDKSKAMILVFQGEFDFILGEKGENPRSYRDLDGMLQGARRHVTNLPRPWQIIKIAEMQGKRALISIFHLWSRIGCILEMKINSNLFCISLDFHYLCTQYKEE